MLNFTVIAAVATNSVIGCSKTNSLLWKISTDLKHFKQQTVGKTVIMGSNTFKSIGKPLPNRRNIVISRHSQFDGCNTYRSLDDALKETGEIVVIGGGKIYEKSIDFLPSKFDITIVDLQPEGDVKFPIDANYFQQDSFTLISDRFSSKAIYNRKNDSDWQTENGIRFKFVEYFCD